MTENEFDLIQEASEGFEFTSLKYADYDDLKDYRVVENSDRLILLHGFNGESKLWEYQWAANDAAVLLNTTELAPDTMIPFMPAAWTSAFQSKGLVPHARWQDYFIRELDPAAGLEGGIKLDESDCAQAAAVTQACRNQSRGFSGQTEDWVRGWLTADDEQTKNKTAFVECQDGRIVGVVFTGTYAHESAKGAIVWIREIAVEPTFQNRGIARRLIRQALCYGMSHGAKRAFLAADELNVGAISLYKSLGFSEGEDEPQNDMIYRGDN